MSERVCEWVSEQVCKWIRVCIHVPRWECAWVVHLSHVSWLDNQCFNEQLQSTCWTPTESWIIQTTHTLTLTDRQSTSWTPTESWIIQTTHTHTDRHTDSKLRDKLKFYCIHIFNCHFPDEPGLSGFPLNFPSPFIPELCTLLEHFTNVLTEALILTIIANHRFLDTDHWSDSNIVLTIAMVKC